MARRTNAGVWRGLVLALIGWAAAHSVGRADDEADLRAAFAKARELEKQAKYDAAVRHYERALELAPRVFGKDDVNTAILLNNVAIVYGKLGRYAEAEAPHRFALAIRERKFGPNHPDVAQSLNNLASLYADLGRYAEAEPLHRRALAIREKALGPDHASVAQSLINLANVYQNQGKYAAAEAPYRRALALRETALGPGHPSVANSLNNLAELYRTQRKYAAAEPLHRRALAIREKALGPDHPDVADSLNNLANLCQSQGRSAEAEPAYRRALAIREKALGPNHRDVAQSLDNLALLYCAQGKSVEAEPLHRRALAINEATFGPDHPRVAKSLNDLAIVRCERNEWSDAVGLIDRQRRGVRRYVARELPAMPEADQLVLLHTTDERYLHAALTLGLERRLDPDIAARSAAWLLNGKAVAHQALAERALLERDAPDPERRALVRKLYEIRRSHAAIDPAAASGTGDYRAALRTTLVGHRRDAERQLAAAGVTAMAPAEPWVELADVRRKLPADGALVELACFRALDFAKNRFRPPRYAAWVIPPAGRGDVQVIDLGPADAIDAAVAAVRQAIGDAQGGGDRNRSKTVELESVTRPKSIAVLGEPDAERQTRTALESLARLVLHPLLPTLAGKGQWIISPDAALWLVPWAALPLDEGTYAVERHAIGFVTSGRQLAALPSTKRSDSPQPVVLADPDFDLAPADATARAKKLLPTYQATPGSPRDSTPSVRLPTVVALPGTAAEAKAVTPALEQYCGHVPGLYLGGNALEAIAKSLRGNRVVIFSTHGFAMPGQEIEHDEAVDRLAGDAKTPAKVKGGGALENPLFRCGLMLAGCNRRGEGTAEDGVLTGLEIVGTDLRGTELVVLSACETGLGDVRTGEGVAGLRQAFQLAGAQSVVATLWQVPDRESAQLMTAFFERLAAGKPKAEALRAAQLQMIAHRRAANKAAHPYYWAAYTFTGQ